MCWKVFEILNIASVQKLVEPVVISMCCNVSRPWSEMPKSDLQYPEILYYILLCYTSLYYNLL